MNIKYPKKSLGQNFLKDKNIIDIIVNSADVKKNDIILEVGPGTGNLTERILSKSPKKIFAIEKDKFLAKKLHEKFNEKIILINEDILKIDEKKYSNSPMIVFGNLPYNISTQILIKWIRYSNLNNTFKKFILMFQKEVAERIIAEVDSKNYGRLAVLSSWKLKIEKIIDVSPNCFYPIPKVKSTVLLIKPKKEYFNIKNPKNLEHITNIFFNQRRKMIKKPYNQIFLNNTDIVNKLNLDLNLRPQNLDFETFYKLTEEYENLRS